MTLFFTIAMIAAVAGGAGLAWAQSARLGFLASLVGLHVLAAFTLFNGLQRMNDSFAAATEGSPPAPTAKWLVVAPALIGAGGPAAVPAGLLASFFIKSHAATLATLLGAYLVQTVAFGIASGSVAAGRKGFAAAALALPTIALAWLAARWIFGG